jgi:hypothetical protein
LRIKALVALALIFAAAVPSQAVAQQSNSASAQLPIVPGTRIRVTAATMVAPIVGSYLETRNDTLVLIEESAGRGIWTLGFDQITKIETTTGQGRTNANYIKRGAVIGGLGVGLLTGIYAATVDPSDSTRKFNKVATIGVGIGVGLAAGALIGSRFAQERWREIGVPRGRLTVMPSRSGWRVGLNFGF